MVLDEITPPPHIFSMGHKSSLRNKKVLREVLKPWMDRMAPVHNYLFQQNGMPAHNSKATQD